MKNEGKRTLKTHATSPKLGSGTGNLRKKYLGRGILCGVLLTGAVQQWITHQHLPKTPPKDEQVETITHQAKQVTYLPLCKTGYFGTEVYVVRRRLTLTAYSSGRLEPEELVDTFYFKTLPPEEICPQAISNEDILSENPEGN